ncbi:MAG TPA: acetolactate synthase small subunit [Firmicutes bacterium]|nr:acetolactate synthase small subunit [Bacillota bacterium]
MNQYTISALVSNKSGVLVRVAALFARRGYNIESLSVCKTENDALSRMTIVLNGDDYILGQMMKQMDKLVDVKKIQQVEESAVCRELLLAKVKTDAATRSQILEISQIFRAKVVDVSPEATILELTGKSSKLDGFVTMLMPYGVMELARTGVTAIGRGKACIKDETDYKEKI